MTIYISLLVALFVSISLFIFGFKNQATWRIFSEPGSTPNLNTVPETPIVDPIYIEILPNIKPATRERWLIFENPTKGFSFEFPSDWNVRVTKNRYVKDNLYEIELFYFEQGSRYRVNFMTGGRGAPNFDFEVIENKNLGTISVTWNKMYRNKELFEAVVSFPNSEFNEYFVGLYVHFSPTNQEKIEKTVDEIVSTLKTI